MKLNVTSVLEGKKLASATLTMAPEDALAPTENNVVNLYPEFRFQKLVGFGGAMTEAAAWSLYQLPEAERTQALRDYFLEGGYTVLRVNLDSCDFSRFMYQAVEDVRADPDLATFSLRQDREHILPAIKAAMAMSPRPLSILLSPWSPPAAWKTEATLIKRIGSLEDLRKAFPPELSEAEIAASNPMVAAMMEAMKNAPKDGSGTRVMGGHLKPEYYPAWAAYLVKYVQAYLAEGIPVKWLTIQNESQAATPWDSCQWTIQEQKTFLRDHLYPAMQAAGLADKVSIYFWDHNKENLLNWVRGMVDETTAPMIGGVAFHWYSGDHFEAVQLVHDRWPDLGLMFSEGCCAFVKDDPAAELSHAESYAHDIIGNLNAGMDTWFDWNLYLDEKGGPNHVGNFCSAPLMLDGKGGCKRNPSYYYIRQFSRFIQPGAVRIGYSKYTDKLDVTAFQNPDGKLVCVLLNREAEEKTVNFRLNGLTAALTLAPRSISTVVEE